MAEPVKLSRERWEMLKRGMRERHNLILEQTGYRVSEPLQVGDVTFLPAEYVPYEPPCTCLTIPMVRA